ncbi:glutaminyl-peptide cyclotransferase-like protein [Bufo gargarizans]|uniref:glutaminyl-peptide cyclotransferase-like protein n=1 Tax=Bufo gargarizans TaxID=30331 RepID=UPI001CF2F6AB|nr:glutaminyl-peptide cyclotransferase-like protein [Bufo gargarizans]
MCPRRAARIHRSPGGPSSRAWSSKHRSLLMLGLGVLLGAGVLLWEQWGENETRAEEPVRGGQEVRPRPLSSARLRDLMSAVSVDRMWSSFLRPMLVERSPGTPGNRLMRELISRHLRSLTAQWTVEFDLFDALTPRGSLRFGSVVATLDPGARRRLVCACHLDSKWFPVDGRGRPFVGATDSAVPCSLILEAVTALDAQLRRLKDKGSPLTLQLFFLDGEEAFGDWTETDSLYGARHLAQRLHSEPAPGGTGTKLDAMDLFVLLDLLGAPEPLILSHFSETRGHFLRLVGIEKRLHDLGLLDAHRVDSPYFRTDLYFGAVEDDHIPFLRRGVPVLHVISTPFPAVWHTHDDTEENLHRPTVTNLCRIFVTFLAETLAL